jgi:hypothetical protein
MKIKIKIKNKNFNFLVKMENLKMKLLRHQQDYHQHFQKTIQK